MTQITHLSEIPNLQTTSIIIDTTNLMLVRLSELSKDSLAKLITIYNTNIKSSMQARLFANTTLIYSLATILLVGLIGLETNRQSVKKIATVITFAAGLTAFFAGFISLVYTSQISDFKYWKNVCVIFMNHPGQ